MGLNSILSFRCTYAEKRKVDSIASKMETDRQRILRNALLLYIDRKQDIEIEDPLLTEIIEENDYIQRQEDMEYLIDSYNQGISNRLRLEASISFMDDYLAEYYKREKHYYDMEDKDDIEDMRNSMRHILEAHKKRLQSNIQRKDKRQRLMDEYNKRFEEPIRYAKKHVARLKNDEERDTGF